MITFNDLYEFIASTINDDDGYCYPFSNHTMKLQIADDNTAVKLIYDGIMVLEVRFDITTSSVIVTSDSNFDDHRNASLSGIRLTMNTAVCGPMAIWQTAFNQAGEIFTESILMALFERKYIHDNAVNRQDFTDLVAMLSAELSKIYLLRAEIHDSTDHGVSDETIAHLYKLNKRLYDCQLTAQMVTATLLSKYDLYRKFIGDITRPQLMTIRDILYSMMEENPVK